MGGLQGGLVNLVSQNLDPGPSVNPSLHRDDLFFLQNSHEGAVVAQNLVVADMRVLNLAENCSDGVTGAEFEWHAHIAFVESSVVRWCSREN